MHYESYDKILGETLFEAKVKAEKAYGKGNYTVITSKRVKHSIYFGFGHKEMFELTIGIINSNDRTKIVTEAPSRPSPSIEISQPRSSFTTFSEHNSSVQQTVRSVATSRKPRVRTVSSMKVPEPNYIKPVNPAIHGMNAYASAPRPNSVSMRAVHGLRSNQEGNDEPRSQKILDDKCIAAEQIDDILNEIMAVKETRARQEKIANVPTAKQPSYSNQNDQNQVTAVSIDRLETYEQRLNDMFDILRNMNQRFGKALDKDVPEIPEGLYYVKKNLLDIETPMEIADQLVFSLKDDLSERALQRPEEAARHTVNLLEKTIQFSPDPDFKNRVGPRIIALIGPTGVGKTTTIAKIAASFGLSRKERLSIALFTLDTYRVGATDQLQQYAKIIDVEMEILYRPEDIDAALPRHMDKDLIIVDTAGRSQKDSDELGELRSFLDRLPDPDKYLVLSATAKYTDMLETVNCFDRIGFEHLIFTKLDETNTVGPLLAVLIKTGKSLAYITNGQAVPDDFRKADFKFFNSRLFSPPILLD